MAKRKSTKKKTEKQNWDEVTFIGGPRAGETLRVMNNPLPPFLRLAFPEWCNYFLRPGTLDYEYDMERDPIHHPHDFRALSQVPSQ